MITPLFYIAVAKCSLCFFVAESPQLIRPYSDLKQSKNTVQYKIFGIAKYAYKLIYEAGLNYFFKLVKNMD